MVTTSPRGDGLLGRAADRPQALDDAPRLAVERDGPAGAGVEDHDPDRRGLDQSLQVGPRAALAAMAVRSPLGGQSGQWIRYNFANWRDGPGP